MPIGSDDVKDELLENGDAGGRRHFTDQPTYQTQSSRENHGKSEISGRWRAIAKPILIVAGHALDLNENNS
jgi:hypothetical protein